MSYLIIDGKCVAKTAVTLLGGEQVRVSWLKSGNELINLTFARASNAKKWNSDGVPVATLHRDKGIYKEFYAGE